MSLASILLGLINILIVVGVLLLIGAIIVWVLGLLGFPIPGQIQRIYMAIVALIALYLLVALLLGLPGVRIIGFQSGESSAAALALSVGTAADYDA